jgi:uncharacterized membrane protein
MKIALLYLITTPILFAIDMVWLVLMRPFYKGQLGSLMADKPKWAAAIIFYLIYIAGILFFAVIPAHIERNWTMALINGAVLGLLCYATYDLTSLAIIDKFPVAMTVVDIVWGIVLTGGVATISYYISNRLGM